jgi:hypothetical protein
LSPSATLQVEVLDTNANNTADVQASKSLLNILPEVLQRKMKKQLAERNKAFQTSKIHVKPKRFKTQVQ